MKKLKKIIFILILLLILIAPTTCQYEPPLSGTRGYETQLVSDPGYFGSPIKWVQAIFEIIPCTYNLIGWTDLNMLIYKSSCYHINQIWMYDPEKFYWLRIGTELPELYVQKAKRDEVLKIVRAQSVRPLEKEPSVRLLYLVDSGLVSPNGQYIAIITQRIYSVFDIVVLKGNSN
jgi:hypothetical protein